MLTPHEFYTKKIVPYLKAILALKLLDKGFTQIDISRILGVSQAAISQYSNNGLRYYFEKLLEVGVNEELYSLAIEDLTSGDAVPDIKDIINFLNDFWIRLMNSGILCKAHRKENVLLNKCNVCIPATSFKYRRDDREQIIIELKRVYSILSKLPEFRELIPEVYSNVARALPSPSSLNDIAAFPGRIIPVKNGIKIVGEPSFGSSKHLAKILIKISKLYPDTLAIMNIKYDRRILNAVRRMGLLYTYTIRYGNQEEDVVKGVIKAIEKYGFRHIIFDKGGKGLEPITYILGSDSYELIEKVMSVIWGLKFGKR